MHTKHNSLVFIKGILIGLISILLVTACGGGDGSGFSANPPSGVDIAQLDGTWSGSAEDSLGGLHTYQVTISGGVITEILIDGVNAGLIGTITKEAQSTVVFSTVLSDGTSGGFIVDIAAVHAVFVDEDFTFGVVQKNAGVLPTFLVNDTDGDWSGHTVQTDLNSFLEFTSSGSCVNLACTGSGNGVTSNIDLTVSFDATFGRWEGTYTNSLGDNGDTTVMLSTDKQFAGSHSCDSIIPFPDGCDFTAWVKQ